MNAKRKKEKLFASIYVGWLSFMVEIDAWIIKNIKVEFCEEFCINRAELFCFLFLEVY